MQGVSRRRGVALGAAALSAEALRGRRVFVGIHYCEVPSSIPVDPSFRSFLIPHCLLVLHAGGERLAVPCIALAISQDTCGVEARHEKLQVDHNHCRAGRHCFAHAARAAKPTALPTSVQFQHV